MTPNYSNQRERRSAFWWFVLFVAAFLFCVCAGACQQTPTVTTETPTSNEQAAATQGSNIHVWVVNAPAKGDLPGGGPNLSIIGPGDAPEVVANRALERAISGGGQASLDNADARYVQNTTITITTGGTAPALTGTNTPTVTPSLTAPFRVDPGVAVPIGVALPGGMVDQAATASGSGQAESAKTSENDLQYARIQALADKLAALAPVLDALGGVFSPPAATPPTTQPAPAD